MLVMVRVMTVSDVGGKVRVGVMVSWMVVGVLCPANISGHYDGNRLVTNIAHSW